MIGEFENFQINLEKIADIKGYKRIVKYVQMYSF